METQKVLITGGKGFIGTNLVSELKQRGHDVRVCDIGQSEGEQYIRCDVGKYRQVERRDWGTKTRLLPSIEAAKRLLDYKPQMKFEDGLDGVHGWFTDNRDDVRGSAEF
ncbi:MAG: NAD-dependent epimerase/dehydratase family protein [Euryarchaeota archaeon]|nr:NAD-dependent epimerase/dehydratase family protein [Euryarchaeota archaeon]